MRKYGLPHPTVTSRPRGPATCPFSMWLRASRSSSRAASSARPPAVVNRAVIELVVERRHDDLDAVVDADANARDDVLLERRRLRDLRPGDA